MNTSKTLKLRGGAAMLAVAVALLLSACGSSSKPSATASNASAASSSATVATTSGSAGTYLTGSGGRAIYLWVADGKNMSACSGACAQVWPPVTASGTPTVAGAAKSADVGTITRSDGAKQVTYHGHPLYYYVPDSAAGSTTGQGSDDFGAKWWLVAPSGSAITSGQPVSQTTAGSTGGGW
jgi:predicted lipoprotein with Yx(FWY)xxD motif